MKQAIKTLALPLGLLLVIALAVAIWAVVTPPRQEVVMALSQEQGQLSVSITNYGKEELYHGNVNYAARLQQKDADGQWRGANGGDKIIATLEGYILKPGQTYSGTFSFAPYGQLSDGDYRIVFFLDRANYESVQAEAEFSIQKGEIVLK